jgi:hypothetical protein
MLSCYRLNLAKATPTPHAHSPQPWLTNRGGRWLAWEIWSIHRPFSLPTRENEYFNGAVSNGKESRFHNGTGYILELAVSSSILDVCAVSLSKICLKQNKIDLAIWHWKNIRSHIGNNSCYTSIFFSSSYPLLATYHVSPTKQTPLAWLRFYFSIT